MPDAAGLFTILEAMDRWLRRHDYAGSDPYDTLNAERLTAVLRSHRRLRQALIQAGKRSPVDLRPVLGVPPIRMAKAMGLVASGYASLHSTDRAGSAARRAAGLLSWLEAARVPTSGGRAWGYEFDVQTRWAFYPAETPNIIVTTFVAGAFLDWYEVDGGESHLEVAQAAAQFILDELLAGGDERPYFAYVPGVVTLIHNANLLGCGLLARLGRITGDSELSTIAMRAAATTLAAQDSRGLWPYGEGATLRWTDGFHTAYVLGGLHEVWRATGSRDVLNSLSKGLGAYIDRLFTPQGEPKYTDSHLYPMDVHSASSAIELFVRAGDVDERCQETAHAVARWAMVNLYDRRGYFYYQRTRWYTNRIPYVRWSQAHMFKALAALAAAS